MPARVTMITSGKGGTGKSTTAVHVGAQLALHGKKVLLVELDSGLRSVDVIAGISGETVYDISDILTGRCTPEKAVVNSALYPGLSIISAPYTGGHIETENLKIMADAMAEVFDEIILDTAAGIGKPFEAARAVANLALIVITPDRVSIRDGRIVAEELENKVPCRLIINMVTPKMVRKTGLQDLDECIDTIGVQLLGVIPEEQNVYICGALGQPLPYNSTAKRTYNNIARRLLGEYVPLVIQ